MVSVSWGSREMRSISPVTLLSLRSIGKPVVACTAFTSGHHPLRLSLKEDELPCPSVPLGTVRPTPRTQQRLLMKREAGLSGLCHNKLNFTLQPFRRGCLTEGSTRQSPQTRSQEGKRFRNGYASHVRECHLPALCQARC
jgi:hypothetical protein